jgi:hypothetical protein
MRISTRAALGFLVGLLAILASLSHADGEAPTRDIVETVLKASWNREATDFTPRAELTLNNVRFGKPYQATLRDTQIDRIPEGAVVTPAIVDFTVRTFYSDQTQAIRRQREARVYQDNMGDWAVMTGSVKGQDTTTSEPAAP